MQMKLAKNDRCTGCFACVNICPKHCISIVEDDEGFLQPAADEKICVECGLCQEVCPELCVAENKNYRQPLAVAAIDKTKENLKMSTSGGFFGVLASYVIENGGCIYGAAFESDFKSVRCQKAESPEELQKLRATKYVQSNIGTSLQDVKRELEKGRLVLFSATACHIAGLKAFCRKDYPNLITLDLICHGVPSPGVYRKYCNNLETIFGESIRNFCFRPKNYIWKAIFPPPRVSFRTSEEELRGEHNSYMQGFLANLYLRKPCYDCKYAKFPRTADFTIGDFWGIEEDSNFTPDTKNGVSCVLLNNEKAEKYFEAISAQVEWKTEPLELVIRRNSRVSNGKRKPTALKHREAFYKYYAQNDWGKVEKYIIRKAHGIKNDPVLFFKKNVLKILGEERWRKIKALEYRHG